jgi:hydroxypyruvate isomerase
MPHFSANLSMLYPEHPFRDRIAAAAADGFQAVECQFPYEHDASALRARLTDHGVEMVLINAPPGDGSAGERGLAVLPGGDERFQRSIDSALAWAQALRCPRIHVMAGVVPAGADRAALRATYVRRLAWAAAQSQGITWLIEPINPRDMPGYFLHRQDDAHAIVMDVGAANLKVQMDLYHCQIVEGDLIRKLEHHLPTGRVGHLQIAGVPDRQEPDRGELNCAALFDTIDRLGYAGWVGAEYRPRGSTREGLGWLPRRDPRR